MEAEALPYPPHCRQLVRILREPSSMAVLEPAELDLALRLARRAKLLGSLAARLQQTGDLRRLPPQAVEQLESARVLADAKVRVALWELDRLAHALEDLPHVRLVALKGCAYLLRQLPNALGRGFADVDLLVPKADLETVETHLAERGWQSLKTSRYDQHYYRAWMHELPPLQHVEREVEVDLHHGILPSTSSLKPRSELLLRAARKHDSSRFETLADADLALHAITHLMFDSEMADALRDLVDVDVLLRHLCRTEDDWISLVQRAAELDLARPLYYALRYCRRLLQTPVPAAALAAAERGRPPRPWLRVMDAVVPRALFPQHPDRPSRTAAAARFVLYLRSHWIRMPAPMLLAHLTRKLWMRRFTSAEGEASSPEQRA